jgi:hypothetical protein
MYKASVILLFIALGISNIKAQDIKVKGSVADMNTHEPLPFVNITYNDGRQGTVSGIDGSFEISIPHSTKKLTFSYVGYEAQSIDLTSTLPDQSLTIKLRRKAVNLNEINIYPGENPAHRIINKVVENRDRNNPEKMRSFSYTSYNKMYFTGIEDTLAKGKPLQLLSDSIEKDSVKAKSQDFLNKQHLLLLEFVSERTFKYPAKNHEKIISSRVSGLTDPMFVLLSTQMQSFSFYNDFFVLLDKRFLNPISPGSTSKYFFLIEDTLYTPTHDSVFVISYRPRKGKNFDGLKGTLYINSNGYAIQNVLASPVSDSELFGLSIQQQYELIDNKQWFPTQLHTDILYRSIKLKTKSSQLYMAAIGKTYFTDIKITPNTDSIKFSNIELEVASDASKKNAEFWDSHRAIPLTNKDSVTYHIIDSVGRKMKLDEKMKALEAIMYGNIPWGIFNIDYRKLLGYNKYEGFHTGLGLATNQKLLKFASVGGFLTYGFKDKDIKYGFFTQLFPYWYSDTKLTLRYAHTISESGKIAFIDEGSVLKASDIFREFFVRNWDKSEEKEISFTFRTLQHFKLNIFLNHSDKTFNTYSFDNLSAVAGADYKLGFTEAGIQIKFAFQEKFMKTPRGMMISMGTKYPIVWFNLIKGVKIGNGDFDYTKYEAKLAKTFISRRFGKTQLILKGAVADGVIPLSNLYSGQGCHGNFNIDVENNFNTMRAGEFYSSEFLSVFFRQNFGNLLFSTKKFKPEIILATSAGWGKLENAGLHKGVSFKTMEKGYYESGLLVNRIISSLFFNMGLGVYYRWGNYSYAKIADNFTYKITLGYSF